MDNRAALRYAQALMDLGMEKKSLETIASDLLALETTIRGSHELQAVLASPVIRPDKKRAILDKIFQTNAGPEVIAFLKLMVDKGRSGLLLTAAEEFRKLLDKKNNVLHAQVSSAVELSGDQQKMIVDKLFAMTGKQIHAAFSLDPSLKGGFIARIGDTLIDASLSHQLEMLREQFKQGGAPMLN